MSHLSPAQLEAARAALTALRATLMDTAAASRAAAAPVELDQQRSGRVSRIDAIAQQSMAAATRQRQLLRLEKVKVALRALEKGEYGLCQRCEEEIAWPRLQARPESAICLACQSELERRR